MLDTDLDFGESLEAGLAIDGHAPGQDDHPGEDAHLVGALRPAQVVRDTRPPSASTRQFQGSGAILPGSTTTRSLCQWRHPENQLTTLGD